MTGPGLVPGASLDPAPPGFPGPQAATRYRRLLDDIISGALPPPPCAARFALPRPSAWSYAVLQGTASTTEAETWAPGVVFGGYIACLADQFAGLVMLTVLPDGGSFLTAGLRLNLDRPMRPGEATVTARVLRLTARQATVQVEVEQGGRPTSRATVIQALRNPGDGGPR